MLHHHTKCPDYTEKRTIFKTRFSIRLHAESPRVQQANRLLTLPYDIDAFL